MTAVGGSGNGGRAYVYTPSGTTWTQSAELAPAGTEGGDFFGNRSVSISGTTIVVGAPDHGAVGNAFVFTNSGGSWSQVADLANSDGTTGDATGSSVAISAVATIAGAPGHVGIGRVYLFPTPPPWHPIIGIEAPDTAVGSDFGASLGVTGTTVIVGAFATAAPAVHTSSPKRLTLPTRRRLGARPATTTSMNKPLSSRAPTRQLATLGRFSGDRRHDCGCWRTRSRRHRQRVRVQRNWEHVEPGCRARGLRHGYRR